MSSRFLSGAPLPFCGGCGHALVVRNTAKALESLGLNPLDVVLVTDIGCHGIIDSNFCTHTVHGIHGRSVALAAGISVSLPKGKVVIVYVGDGGAVIGLQHLIDAAHRNIDMTVVLFNNMLYGMTGGQPSGLTPCGYRTPIYPLGNEGRCHDLCRLVYTAGAASAQRVIARGDFSGAIVQAISTSGFSLVELMEHCPSYGVKYNPGRAMEDIVRDAGLTLEPLRNTEAVPFRLEWRKDCPSLLALDPIERLPQSGLNRSISILLGGSAGEGVQVAAEVFARAAAAAGLSVAKKGSYPVTVGTGYSAAEIVLSPEPILYVAADSPDIVALTSEDGFSYYRHLVGGMRSGWVLLDDELPDPATGAEVTRAGLRREAGPRGAALYALVLLLRRHALFPVGVLLEEIRRSKLADRPETERLLARCSSTASCGNGRDSASAGRITDIT